MKAGKTLIVAGLIMLLALTGCGKKDADRVISFEYEIEGVFALTGRGTTTTGTVTSGSVKTGDTIYVLKEDGTEIKTRVVLLEVVSQAVDEAVEGDKVGIELENLEKDQIAVGDRLVGYEE